MSDRPYLTFLTDEDVFHCDNDSPIDLKIYLSGIRLEYQGQIDSDNKEKSCYQNALLMINSFSRYPEHTATEINIFEIVSNALNGYTQRKIDAVDYWVDQCDKRDEEINRLSSMLKDIIERLAHAPNTNNYDWEKWRVELVIKNKPEDK